MKKNILVIAAFLIFTFGTGLSLTASVSVDNWQVTHSGTSEIFRSVGNNWPLSFAIRVTGNVLQSQVEGLSWDPPYHGNVGGSVFDMAISDMNSKMVAVGLSGLIATSTDGSQWSIQTPGTTQHLYCVSYKTLNPSLNPSPLFIAGGDAGTILVSTDANAINWSQHQVGASRITGIAITDQGSVTCVNAFGQVFISNNAGQSWSLSTSLSNVSLNSIEYGNGLWVIGGRDTLNGKTASIWTSTNRVNWTKKTIPYRKGYVYDITYTGTDFVAVAENLIISSPDGTNWSLKFTAPNTLYAIEHSMYNVVAVGVAGVICASN
jgi:photosystem II stability/assembly factor-like uncharacterized protein